MSIRRTAGLAAGIGAAALLGACVSPVERPEPAARQVDAQSLASAQVLSGTPEGEWPQAQWWKGFGDAQLDALVDEALAAHPTLRLARARLAQAQARLDAALASATPGFGGSADVTYQRYSLSGTVPPPVAGTTRTSARLTLDFAYEIDYADRNRSAIAAARAEGSAVAADAYAARLALVSAVARSYFQLQKLFALRAIADRELAQSERKIALLRQRVSAGLDTEVQLNRAQTVPPQVRADGAQLDAAVALARDQLAALAGQGPDRGLAIQPDERYELAAQAYAAGQSVPAADLPAKLPLDLLGRRPDLAAARWRAESAARDIEVARKRFLPNVNLLAFAGIASLGLDRLLASGSGIAGVGPAVRLPLFSAGGLQAALRGREADYDLAVEQYNALVLEAVREVADQVQSRRALEAERAERARAVEATDRTRRVALERYQGGVANYLDVLDADAALFALQRAEADLNGRVLEAEVNLYRVLGGGYEDGRTDAR